MQRTTRRRGVILTCCPCLSKNSQKMDVARVVNKLVRQGIKLIAVDFDKTLIKLHTHGLWHKGSEELARHVRPSFQHFLVTAMRSEIHVAIVTFSTQIELIEAVLQLSFPADTAGKIIIRGGNTPPGPPGPCSEGKQPQILSVLEELKQKDDVTITFTEIVLLDDDPLNIQIARKNDIPALLIRDDKSLTELEKMIDSKSKV